MSAGNQRILVFYFLSHDQPQQIIGWLINHMTSCHIPASANHNRAGRSHDLSHGERCRMIHKFINGARNCLIGELNHSKEQKSINKQ